MVIKRENIENLLWFSFAASIATLAVVNSLRINLGIITLPMPVFIIGIIAFLSPFLIKKSGYYLHKEFINIFTLAIAIVFWTFFSIIVNIDNYGILSNYQDAFKESIKLLISTGVFASILILFKKDYLFAERIWKIVIWSSSILLGYFIIKSLSSGNLFLSTNVVDMTTRLGRNTVGWFSAMIFPFALSNFYFSKNRREKIINSIPFLIISFAVIYSVSRSSWLMSFISILVMIFCIGRINWIKGIKIFFALILVASISIVIAYYTLQSLIEIDEIISKLTWFLNPTQSFTTDSGEFYDTYGKRFKRIFEGLNIFTHYPIFGVGLKNFVFHPLSSGGQTHNDYSLALAETGFGGILLIIFLFLSFLFCFRSNAKINVINNIYWPAIASRSAFISLIASMNFIDAYRTPQVWIFLGLIFVTISLEKSINFKN